MNNFLRRGLLLGALASPLLAFQDVRMPLDLDRLAARATESVDVTLDASMLRLASGFLSKEDHDEMQAKKLISRLKGVYVRSFDFAKEGQYSPADIEAIRSQLRSPAWGRIVGVKSIKGENTEIFLKKNGDEITGLVVIDAEPKELTVVHIDGPINPEELSELGGHLGIPKLGKGRAEKGSKDGE